MMSCDFKGYDHKARTFEMLRAMLIIVHTKPLVDHNMMQVQRLCDQQCLMIQTMATYMADGWGIEVRNQQKLQKWQLLASS